MKFNRRCEKCGKGTNGDEILCLRCGGYVEDLTNLLNRAKGLREVVVE